MVAVAEPSYTNQLVSAERLWFLWSVAFLMVVACGGLFASVMYSLICSLLCLLVSNEMKIFSLMRIHLISWIFAFTLLLGTLSAQTDTYVMQRALQRFTEAYGGGRDATALTSISIEGTQAQDGNTYEFLLRKKRPDSIRYRLSFGEKSVTTGYDGRRGWLHVQDGLETTTRLLEKEELQVVRAEATFDSPLFRHLQNRYTDVEMVGRDIVEGQTVFVYSVQESVGQRSRYYLHSQLPHIVKREQLNDQDEVILSTYYRDYREVRGYPFAFEIENRVGDLVVSTVQVENIIANPGLLSFYFTMPE